MKPKYYKQPGFPFYVVDFVSHIVVVKNYEHSYGIEFQFYMNKEDYGVEFKLIKLSEMKKVWKEVLSKLTGQVFPIDTTEMNLPVTETTTAETLEHEIKLQGNGNSK